MIEVAEFPAAGGRHFPAALLLPSGFFLIIVIGTALLMLPIAAEDRTATGFVTALFIATSAVSTTGLVTVDTADHWSGFGEMVVLTLIQLGGLGFMVSATLLLLAFRQRISLRFRLTTAESLGRLGVTSGARLTDVVRRIVIITLSLEAAGFLLMVPIVLLSASTGSPLRDIWRAFFTTLSAFNTAGFDIEGGGVSLSRENANLALLGLTIVLALFGASGYAVWSDLWGRRRTRRLAVDTKLLLTTVAVLWSGAFVAIVVIETGFGTSVRGGAWPQQLLDSAYTVLSAGTTVGFAQENIGELRDASKGLLLGIMFIGGASGSTAGGIKVTTWAILLFAIIASLRGQENVHAFEREIASPLVHRALSVALLSVAIVFAVSVVVSATTHSDFAKILFEGISAFGTVGLSTGITPEMSVPSQLAIIVVMFIGRVGPLSLALALAGRTQPIRHRYAQETVSIG